MEQVDIFGETQALTSTEKVAAIRAVKDANPDRPDAAVQEAKRQGRLFEPQMEGQLALEMRTPPTTGAAPRHNYREED